MHGKFFGYICACLDLKKVTYVTWKKKYRKVHNSFQKILSIKNDVRVDLGCKGEIDMCGYWREVSI